MVGIKQWYQEETCNVFPFFPFKIKGTFPYPLFVGDLFYYGQKWKNKVVKMWPNTTKGTSCLLLTMRFLHYLIDDLTSFQWYQIHKN